MSSNDVTGRSHFRLPGLDGLRAIAVAAVIAFHFGVPGFAGGFLGVDVFFVISGFLITTLLLREFARTGRIGFIDFYRRRVRRLVPAMLAVVGVCLLATTWIWTDDAALVRRDALASAFYSMNWVAIFGHVNYFVATGRPSMLAQLWSLAVEEQFYLLWPLVLLLVLRRPGAAGRRPRKPLTRLALRRTLIVCLYAAAGSTLLMAVIAVATDVPYGANTTRVYFGTDTHAMGLMTGAALAAANALFRLARGRPVKSDSPRPPGRSWRNTDLAAIGFGAVLLWMFHDIDEYTTWLYRGGFLLASIASAGLLVCAVRRGSATARLLDTRPFVWVGARSYSLYLWHWPVAVVTRPGIDLTLPAPLVLLLRLVLTLALAEASYRWIEAPFRSGLVHRWLHPGRPLLAVLRHALAGAGTVAAGAVILLAVTITPPAPQGVRANAAQLPSTSTSKPVKTTHRADPKATTTPTPTHRASRTPTPPAVSAYGDSVLLGAASQLTAQIPRTHVTAVEGAQPPTIFGWVLADKAAGRLGQVVVVHAGNNGLIKASDLDGLLDALANRARVVLIDDHVDRAWAPINNRTIEQARAKHRNVTVLDWQHDSQGHRDWLYPDGLHLTPAGQRAYADLVAAAISAH